MDKTKEMEEVCLLIARLFPGRPYLLAMGLDSGTVTLGNTSKENQYAMLCQLVSSFNNGTERLVYEGPIGPCECSGYDFEPKTDVLCSSCGRVRKAVP